MGGKEASRTGLLSQDTLEQRNLSIQSIKPVEIHSQQYIEETSWLDNKLVFKNETFEELSPRLERWYNVNIRVKNTEMNAYHFTGIFQNESLDQALHAMQLIKPFKYKISNDEVTIE
jgi:ferric-dicitrate binding protein FerR (iron transport regulator)